MVHRFSKTTYILLICLFVFMSFPIFASASTNKSSQLIATAKEYINVPYQYGGSTPRAFDCSGFLGYVFKESLGMTLPRTVADMYHLGTPVSKANLQEGDIVFFETYKKGPSHAGIYIGKQQFIHSSSSKGVTISSINDPYYWGPRYIGAKRVLSEASAKAKEPTREELIASLAPGEFLDVPKDHWAYEAIKQMANDGFVSGVDKGMFAPTGEMNRAAVATLISNVKPTIQTASYHTRFADVSESHWAHEAIQAVTAAGIFPVGGSSFAPTRAVTRAEAAMIIVRAFDLQMTENVRHFTDVTHSTVGAQEILIAASNGIMNGYDDGTYRPNETLSRAQVAKILHNVLY